MNAAASLPKDTNCARGRATPTSQYRFRPSPASAGWRAGVKGHWASRALHLDPNPPFGMPETGPETNKNGHYYPLTQARCFRDVKPSAQPAALSVDARPQSMAIATSRCRPDPKGGGLRS
jgi:hypothetical protein